MLCSTFDRKEQDNRHVSDFPVRILCVQAKHYNTEQRFPRSLPSIQTCVTQREHLLASRRSFKRTNGKVVRPWLRTGSDRTVGRNYWSAALPRSLPPAHCRGKSPRLPSAQGLGGARTCTQMLQKTRVFWVLTKEELPTFRRSVVSPASQPNTRHLWRPESSSAPL